MLILSRCHNFLPTQASNRAEGAEGQVKSLQHQVDSLEGETLSRFMWCQCVWRDGASTGQRGGWDLMSFLHSCHGWVDETMVSCASRTRGPHSKCLSWQLCLMSKAFYPHCPVPRRGRKAASPIAAYSQIVSFVWARVHKDFKFQVWTNCYNTVKPRPEAHMDMIFF